uniref:Uncharacterized protein n=1 Tax=Aegilops tauschii subsp. strangulata TaxID=200361 RepID=A0A453KQR9_AEGTS
MVSLYQYMACCCITTGTLKDLFITTQQDRGRSGEGDRVTTARAQETSGSCSPRMPTSGSGKKLLNPGDREIVEPRADPPRTPPPRGASTLSELRAALACYHDLNKSGGSREEEVLIGGGRRSCHRGGGFLESGGRVEE